jgi:hypothetical protein
VKRLTQLHTEQDDGILGDCWRTAIACLLDCESPLEVPHFIDLYPDETTTESWNEAVKFVRGYKAGFTLGRFRSEHKELDLDYLIAGGKSPRGDWEHCVIINAKTYVDQNNYEIVWDVHPSRTGLDSALHSLEAIIRIPSEATS